MSDEEAIFEDLEIDAKAWNQMEKNLKQHGYREGASGGRETTFQAGFDRGYSGGFKTGKALGFAKGSVDCLNGLLSTKVESIKSDIWLDDPSKGSCVMCSGKDFSSFDEIVTKQKDKELEILTCVNDLKVKLKNEYG